MKSIYVSGTELDVSKLDLLANRSDCNSIHCPLLMEPMPTKEEEMRERVKALAQANEVVFLEDWRESRESILEFDLAKRLKIPMKFFNGDKLEDKPQVGMKFDDQKLDWSLLDLSLLHGALRVLKYGEKKYESHNWQKVDNGKKRYFNALLRHMEELQNDKQFDEESGCDVIDHVIVNALFLKYFIEEEKKDGEGV